MALMKKHKALPGTLMYTGDTTKETVLKHIQFGKTELHVHDKYVGLRDDIVDWIVFEGLSNIELIRDLLATFGVDTLTMEDIFNVTQRTKLEVHDTYLFTVVKYPYVRDGKIGHDYISILLFKDVILSFSENVNMFTEDIIARIENKDAQIRHRKHDYLYYVLLDMIVDETIQVQHQIEDEMDEMEEELLNLTSNHQVKLYNIRKELLFLRSLTTQLLMSMPKDLFTNPTFFRGDTPKYCDDVIDHLLAMNAKVLSQIDISKHILDVYINNISNKMNQIMTTLTIFSAIFIPLSFIAGVFGMNFVNFPVLQSDFGMLYFILICVSIPTFMLIYFKRKGWF